MLQRLEVKNFLALRDVGIDLEPFTVLVGANASGKTTILEALHRICGLQNGSPRVITDGYRYAGYFAYEMVFPSEMQSYNSSGDIEFTATANQVEIMCKLKPFENEKGYFQFTQSANKIFPHGNTFEINYPNTLDLFSPLQLLSGFLPESIIIQANFSSLSRPSYSPLPIPFLERDGAGLATICVYLQQEMPDVFSRVQAHLVTAIQGLKRFRIRRTEATTKNHVNLEPDVYWHGIAEQLIFDFDDAIGVPAKYVSEGTLLVLCILVAAARFEGEALILIDDLERGLHPKAVKDLIGALRKLQEINPKLQIVATSHSPYILSELKPQEVRVVARDPSNGTVVGRLSDHPDFAKWSEVMDVGEFWSHVGEDWLLKQKEYA